MSTALQGLLHPATERVLTSPAMSHMKSLQQYQNVLTEDPSSHKDVFELFLRRAQEGDSKEKLLATEVLCTYSPYFPDLIDTVVDRLIDLCEEENLELRLHVLRWFPTMIDNVPSEILRLGDVLLQLMSTAEDEELEAVQSAIDAVLSRHPYKTLDIFFYHINVSEPTTREDTLSLLLHKLDTLSSMGAKFQIYLLKKVKEFLASANMSEFQKVLNLLEGLSIINSPVHMNWLVSLQVAMGVLPLPWTPLTEAKLDELKQGYSVHSAAGFSSLVSFGILKNFDKIPMHQQQPLLQHFVEHSPITSRIDAELCLPNLYHVLKKELLVPTEDSATGLLNFPQFNFTVLEPVLIFFHQVISHNPGNLYSVVGLKLDPDFVEQRKTATHDEGEEDFPEDEANSELLANDLMGRIYYLQHYSKLCMTKLKDFHLSASSDETSSFRINAVNTTQNIHYLCKALSKPHITPATNLIFSWHSSKELIPASVYKLAKGGAPLAVPTQTVTAIPDTISTSMVQPKKRVVYMGGESEKEAEEIKNNVETEPKVAIVRTNSKYRTLRRGEPTLRSNGGAETLPMILTPSALIQQIPVKAGSSSSAPIIIRASFKDTKDTKASGMNINQDANVRVSVKDSNTPTFTITKGVTPAKPSATKSIEGVEPKGRRVVFNPTKDQAKSGTYKRQIIQEESPNGGTRVVMMGNEKKRKVEFTGPGNRGAKKAKNNNDTPRRQVFTQEQEHQGQKGQRKQYKNNKGNGRW